MGHRALTARRRERYGIARDVTVPELAQESDGCPFGEPVNLIEENNERFAGLPRKHRKEHLYAKVWRLRQKFRNRRGGIAYKFMENWMRQQIRTHSLYDLEYTVVWIGIRLNTFNGEIKRDTLACRVDAVHKALKERGLAGLPRRMYGKVLLTRDKAHDLRQALHCRNHVVFDRIARPRDVEELFHGTDYSKNGGRVEQVSAKIKSLPT